MPGSAPDLMAVSTRWRWLIAILISAGLLVIVITQVDGRTMLDTARNADPWLLLLALVALQAEGISTALRLRVFTEARMGSRSPLAVSRYLQITADYVVMLAVLPARLGEVAGIGLLCRGTGLRAAPATINLFVQRLFDVTVLAVVFVLGAVLQERSWTSPLGAGFGALLIVGLVVALRWLWLPLGWCASALLRFGRTGRLRKLTHMLLEARTWHRRGLDPQRVRKGLTWTLSKWATHLVAFALVLRALHLPVSLGEAMLLGAAFNCLSVVPLQTVGGIGIGEAGLAGLLVLQGQTVETAASAAILVRLVLLIAPPLFWLWVRLLTAGRASEATA